MLLDFDRPETPDPPFADVCIVGAGAAGVALATELLAAGRSVVLLEGGGREQEARSQDIYRSHIAGQAHRGIHEGRFRTYGGTTTRWGGQILELQDIDFAARAWVPGSGWPFAKSELTSFYERALRYAGLRRVERDDAAVWRELGLSAHDASFARDTLGPAFAMMYSRWLPERNVADIHARTLETSRRLKVYTHANVVGFRLNTAGNALEALHVRGFSGRETTVRAHFFVLSLGGIETNRLLLQPAREGTLPWQANGLLGRHYQDHIGVNNIPIHVHGAQPPWHYFGYRTARGFRFHNKLWLTPAEQQRLGTLNVAATIGPDLPSNPARDEAMQWLRITVRQRRKPAVGELVRKLPHVAALAGERLSEHYRGEAPRWKRLMLTVHAEQSPLSDSRIQLTDERDELGLLRASLDWRISAHELHTVRAYVRRATEIFAERRFATIQPPAGFFDDDAHLRSLCEDSYHHMGGTRMAAHAADGIVTPELQLHGVANAFVCSASVFPTSGYSNPTHTVLALAMRLADKLDAALPSPAIRSRPPSIAGDMRSILLPGRNARSTSQLGFGCAYLLGPGIDAAKSRRLLDAAWDAGIRHFDAARLYGMGRTEALLGEFLAAHPDATVTSKFGVIPPTSAERVIMAAGRLAPALGKVLPQRKDKAIFRARDAQQALDTSLRALGRDRVDLYLLHEATAPELVHPDLLAWLERKREAGVIGEFGVGGEYASIPALVQGRAGYIPVLQFERSILGPELDTGRAWTALYRTFAPAARAVTSMLDREPDTLRQWSEETGAELAEPSVVGRLLLRAALDRWPRSLQLFSTGSEEHIFGNVEAAADTTLAAPAARLAHLLSTRPELGRTLYGGTR